METPSRIATFAAGCGSIGALAFAVGPATIQLGLLSSYAGFRVFTVGVLLGLLAFVFGAVGLWRTRETAGRAGRERAWLGTALGALLLGIVVAAVGSAGAVPAINDISTDLDDPPAFSAAGEIEANRGRDLSYPGEEFARQQRPAYPDLVPIRLSLAPASSFERARDAAEALGWTITWSDEKAGVFEATQTSRIFHFVDDVVVRVRPDADGSVVDVRSKSRDGKGDMGTNAARIRALRDALLTS